ncbi:MAG: hypothetical protein JG759_151 [Thermoanaerobacter sp.]|jgi:hypothetical protein|nr:hypothetical protein [Thermoanaerobacter sp.]
MKYQDDLQKGIVNGKAVGIKTGSPTPDALNPNDDGYDHLRAIEHVGTILQDGKEE